MRFAQTFQQLEVLASIMDFYVNSSTNRNKKFLYDSQLCPADDRCGRKRTGYPQRPACHSLPGKPFLNPLVFIVFIILLLTGNTL